jgi:membrane protease YdiL (CAAX protease family)
VEHPQRRIQKAGRCAAHRCGARALRGEPHIRSLVEVGFVSAVVVALLSGCRWAGGHRTWFLGPFILTAGALLPMLVYGGHLSDLGLRLGRIRRAPLPLIVSGVCMLGLGFAGVLMWKHWSIEPPVSIFIPKDKVLPWVLFQFIYVAVPEELFFRGYILSNSMGLRRKTVRPNPSAWGLASLVFSAGIFALSHVLVSGDGASGFTFFPGLIFAWLFVKIDSLIPVIVLHGVANIGYALILEATV